MAKSIDEILEGLSLEDRAIIEEELSRQGKIEGSLQEAYTIINKSPSVAFTWKNSEGWPVEFVTENVEKLFGYTAEELKSGKVPYAQCVHPDDLERVAGEVSQFSNEEGRSDFVHVPYRIVTKNGEVKTVDDKTSIKRDKEGNVTHYQGILTNITEKKKAEHETKERIKELNGLLNLSRLVDESDYLNTILNKFVQDVAPNSMQYPDKVIVNIAIDEKEYNNNNNNNNNNVESLTSPIKVKGEKRGLLTIGYSEEKGFIKEFEQKLVNGYAQRLGKVIERFEAEEKLKKNEYRLKAITESANDAIISSDSKGNVITWNSAASKILGYNSEEIIGENITLMIPERLRARHLKGLERMVVNGKKTIIKPTELFALTKEGKEISVELTLGSWNVGDEIYFTGIIRDITERKQKEKYVKITHDISKLLVERSVSK